MAFPHTLLTCIRAIVTRKFIEVSITVWKRVLSWDNNFGADDDTVHLNTIMTKVIGNEALRVS